MYILADQINWQLFEESFRKHYREDFGRPAKPIRLMVTLILLKHIRNLNDESAKSIATTAENLNKPGKNYAYHLIREENRDYLKTLPAHIRLEYKFSNNKLNLVFAHGSTRSIDEYVLIDTNQNYVLELLDEADADMLFVGHSHKPYHRILEIGGGKFKHVVNLGSVGKPKDGDPRGCYVILNVNENSSSLNKGSIQVEFRRVEYDVEASAKAIEESLLPDEFAERLRSAD